MCAENLNLELRNIPTFLMTSTLVICVIERVIIRHVARSAESDDLTFISIQLQSVAGTPRRDLFQGLLESKIVVWGRNGAAELEVIYIKRELDRYTN